MVKINISAGEMYPVMLVKPTPASEVTAGHGLDVPEDLYEALVRAQGQVYECEAAIVEHLKTTDQRVPSGLDD